MKKIIAAFHNFFHAFRKDDGAHFAYNLGVRLIRTGVLLVLLGLVILAVSLSMNSFHMKYIGDPDVSCTVEKVDDGDITAKRFMAHFKGRDEQGAKLSVDEYIPEEVFNELQDLRWRAEPPGFMLYKVTFNRGGGELYISERRKLYAMLDYASCHAETLPLSLAGMWLSFLAAFMMFLIGRKQMKIGLKYPRNDVPAVLSGAPVISDAPPQGTDEKYYVDINEIKALPLTETNTENE